MSLRLEMLQAARLAPKVLGEAAGLVRGFVLGQQNQDGGFRDRVGKSDLYYTVFALDALIALGVELPRESVGSYLRGFGPGEALDLVHVCCLARASAALAGGKARDTTACSHAIATRIEGFRAHDGGYSPKPGSDHGTAYGAFLALGAYQDLGFNVPTPERLSDSLRFLMTPDGAWANEPGMGQGSTNATAAAVTVLPHLGGRMPSKAGTWLLERACATGGFAATPLVPMPDLLSTATALHALACIKAPLEGLRESCLDYVDSLWTNEGSFHGHWADDSLDCEYTFYGLLALGHLA